MPKYNQDTTDPQDPNYRDPLLGQNQTDPNAQPPSPGTPPPTGYVTPGGQPGGYVNPPAGGFQFDPSGNVTNAPSGYSWDPNLFALVQNAPGSPTSSNATLPPPAAGAPTGGGAAPSPGGAYGGFNNIPGLFGQIFGGLPGAPNSQVGGGPNVPQFSQPSPYEQALRDAIMSAINEGQSPISQNDPVISPMIQAMQGQAQRAMDRNAQQTAEQMYAQGLPVSGGGYGSRVAGFNQLTNEATQGNVANLMVNQLNDRRNRLMTALNLGSNYLNSEQSRILQAELANVSNSLAVYGMQMNSAQGILGQLLQNAQYYSGLGTNANQFAQNQNNAAVTNPLG